MADNNRCEDSKKCAIRGATWLVKRSGGKMGGKYERDCKLTLIVALTRDSASVPIRRWIICYCCSRTNKSPPPWSLLPVLLLSSTSVRELSAAYIDIRRRLAASVSSLSEWQTFNYVASVAIRSCWPLSQVLVENYVSLKLISSSLCLRWPVCLRCSICHRSA